MMAQYGLLSKMPTIIDGSTGVDNHKSGSVTQSDLAANVAGNGPAFSVSLGSAQTVTSGTNTKIQLNTKVFDTHNAFDNVTDFRFQPQVAGYYLITMSGYSRGTSITGQQIILRKNGGGSGIAMAYNQATVDSIQSASAVTFLNGSTDYLELYGIINATSNPRFDSGTTMTGCLLRAA